METIKELNMMELNQVNGGSFFCLGIGFSNAVEANACAHAGSTTEEEMDGLGVDACAFIGLGIGGCSDQYISHNK